MIIIDFSVSSLSEFFVFKDRIKVIRPKECSRCDNEDCFWKHGQYNKQVCEQGAVESIPVQRLICKHCRLTVSVQFAFLVPYRQFTLSVIAGAATIYLERRSETYRSLAAELSGNGDSYEHRPNFSQLWRWVHTFASISKLYLAVQLQRAAIVQNKESQVAQIWEHTHVEPKKAHTKEKLTALNAAARVIAFTRLLLQESEDALIKLQTYLATKVNGLFSIFAGHTVRMSATHNMQHVLF